MKIKIREAVDKNGESLVFLTDDELNILQQALRQYKGCFAHDKKEDLNGVDIRNHENSLGLAGRMAETVERSLEEIHHPVNLRAVCSLKCNASVATRDWRQVLKEIEEYGQI